MSLWNIKMLYYDRIDVSEGIYIDKTSPSKSVIFVTIGISWIKVSAKCLQLMSWFINDEP